MRREGTSLKLDAVFHVRYRKDLGEGMEFVPLTGPASHWGQAQLRMIIRVVKTLLLLTFCIFPKQSLFDPGKLFFVGL